MLNKRILFVSAMLFVLLWLGSPTSVLSTPRFDPNAPLGSGFTYQGYLKDASGSPIHDTCDFTFQLWDAASGGSQIGTIDFVTGVNVVHGYFSALVNAGSEFGLNSIDNTYARWLEVAVMCSGDVSYTLLGPRQAITWTPPTHNHWAQTWSGSSGTGLILSGGGTGLHAGGSSYGVYGEADSTSGKGVYGYATATTGYAGGVYGKTDSTSGAGVFGLASATEGINYGVYGSTNSNFGRGVYGLATATTGYTNGVFGETYATNGKGLYGLASATAGFTFGIFGESYSSLGTGVYGWAGATTGTTYGVFGGTISPDGYGVYGQSSGSTAPYAGYFLGDVHVSGDFMVGGTKAFKIDHPLDPANRYLYHYSVESPDVVNQYTGNVTLDTNGEAWVDLPAWFEALNTDFRYQLTPIGEFAPLYVVQKIKDNRFKIAGGSPGMEVSWQVTALRNDPYMQQYPQPVEQQKPEGEQGTFLYPELYGKPEELGLDYQNSPDTPAQHE